VPCRFKATEKSEKTVLAIFTMRQEKRSTHGFLQNKSSWL